MAVEKEPAPAQAPLGRARERLSRGARWVSDAISPGEIGWRGAALGLSVTAVAMLALHIAFASSGLAALVAVIIAVPIEVAIVALVTAAILLALRLLGALPARYRAAVAGGFLLLSVQVFTGSLMERLVPAIYVILSASIVGGGAAIVAARVRAGGHPRLSVWRPLCCAAAGVAALTFAAYWLARAGDPNPPVINAAAVTQENVAPIDLPDPGAPGPYPVKQLSYGSGRDRRPEYGKGAALTTPVFNGSRFFTGWRGADGWARTRYWGFNASALPINALVWYPEGEGPFPLVLIVHGNHRMGEPSERGYAYLCEDLASHGFIAASVDENFLNGAPWYDFATVGLSPLQGDNALRGVLLLEHLQAFRRWSKAEGNPFFGKVDMTRIALAGHSRGGEAVTVAAAFNRLSYYPDDASIRFDYHFDIRSLVAIATTDRQYQPGGKGIDLEGVNFLALQGTNDADVPYFQGMQQFERLKLTPGSSQFKAGVHIHRANHGQFNSVWGQFDKSVWPRRLFFNRKPLLASADQERVARAYITAFLSATLKGEAGYVRFFQDYRAGRAWLPDTIYLNRYRDAKVELIAAFGEDIDLTTTTLPGGQIAGEGLTIWREQPPGHPALWDAIGVRTAHLGWDRRRTGKIASYTISLPDTIAPLTPSSEIYFAIADAYEVRRRRRGSPPREPIDLSVEVIDAAGAAARVPLSAVSLLQPRPEARIWKGWFAPREAPPLSVFKTFIFPMSLFLAANPRLDVSHVSRIRLVFDRTPEGLIALDNVGLRR